MTAALVEWLNLILRWAHVMAGIAWIGTSFFFIWLEASLKKRTGQPADIAGESWMVHGGGFYLAEKYTVAPARMPDELHWFKYEAYFTWLTGFLPARNVREQNTAQGRDGSIHLALLYGSSPVFATIRPLQIVVTRAYPSTTDLRSSF